MLTQERVKELFAYHEDGHLIWTVQNSNRAPIGSIAGTKRSDGRYAIRVYGKNYMLHRIIFLWHHGIFPKEVDHKDNNHSHNRISNLRAATRAMNGCNVKKRRNNKSGFKGVDWHKSSKTYRACITVNRRHVHIGHFRTPEDAHAAYCEAAKRYQGEFFNPG